MKTEPQWKELDGGYCVSDSGDVKSPRGKILRPFTHKSGHLYINMGRKTRHQVHRLVLLSFGPPQPDGTECRHLDGDPQNNHISNLAWGTRKENVRDFRDKNGRHMVAKMNMDTVRDIRASFNGSHGDRTRLSKEFGLNLSSVCRILKGQIYQES